MKTISAVLAFVFVVNPQAFAQFSESFSDGNLTENPAWSGALGDFIVNSDFELQLNASEAGTSWLSTALPVAQGEVVEWEFFIRQSFSPSGANFGRVYLMSDQPQLTDPLNGFYLQFGEAGSNDAVTLFRQSGDDVQAVCRATAGAIAAAFAIGIKVTYTDGLWELYVDYGGGTGYVRETSRVERANASTSFFGVLFTYTITNATRFYFDSLRVRRSVPPDITPPGIASISFTSSNAIGVTFTEKVEPTSAENSLHYFLSPEYGHPSKTVLQADGTTVQLIFERGFMNGYEVTLSVTGVADDAGNVMTVVEAPLLYFVPTPVGFGDVVINEIFADPAPQVKLPTAEFVELFNRSDQPIQLDGWRFSDGVSNARLTARILLPGRYVILCEDAAVHEFDGFGPVVAASNFPTLNNGGDPLALLNAMGEVIDSVRFSAGWYRNEDKAGGGWSLERIDPANFCAEGQNWLASEDATGGTPGRKNSVYATMPDHTGPRLLYAIPIATDSLLVVFDETLDAMVPTPGAFSITPPIPIEAVTFSDDEKKRVRLKLSEAISTGRDYALRVRGIYDCPGNEIQADFSRCTFVMPQVAAVSDVVINEILFNPRSTGVDFVEIYNRSEKTIDLQNWSVRNASAAGIRNTTRIAALPLLMEPGGYKVLTEDAVVLSGEYINGRPGAFWETDLPPFNDDAGTVALLRDDGLRIDSMAYVEEMHSPFVRDGEGISLERISPVASGAEAVNWHSSSAATGYASPGYANSATRGDLSPVDAPVTVEPEIIQPMVATRDFARIKFWFARTGLIANVRVFDAEGRLIRHIAENELLGSQGFFRWDGDRDDGSPARTGYYQVWFEVFDATGFARTYKRRIAVY